VSGQFIDPNLVRHLTFLNNHLTTRTWFAGDEISGADIQMSFPIEAAVQRGGERADVAKLAAWVARIKERPAFKKAIERGGTYELM
jgi:glutathione S-transferase